MCHQCLPRFFLFVDWAENRPFLCFSFSGVSTTAACPCRSCVPRTGLYPGGSNPFLSSYGFGNTNDWSATYIRSKATCFSASYVRTWVVLTLYLQTFGQPHTRHNAMNAESIDIESFTSMAYKRLIIHRRAAIIDHGTISPGLPKIYRCLVFRESIFIARHNDKRLCMCSIVRFSQCNSHALRISILST